MSTAKNKRERYIKWIMQVVNEIQEPFTTRDILSNWNDYAPIRFKPQMNLLANMVRRLESRGLIVRIGKETKIGRKRVLMGIDGLQTFHGTGGDYMIPLFVRAVEEE